MLHVVPINVVGQHCVLAPTPASGASSLPSVPMIGEGATLAHDYFPAGSSLASMLGSSAAPSTALAQVSPPASTAAPPQNCLQAGIRKLKQYTDGTIGYAYLSTSGEPYSV
jgi:hypothetical protein